MLVFKQYEIKWENMKQI